MRKSPFGVVSKWTEMRDPKSGKITMMGGYYGDYTVPKGTQYSYQKKRKNLLGIIPRKPKTVSGTYKKDTTAPVLRYISNKGNQYVLPSGVPTADFDKTKIKTGGTGPNEPYWGAVREGEKLSAEKRKASTVRKSMKKLTPLQVSQKLSQASGDKASLRWAKGQEARQAARPKKPKVWNVTPFQKSAFGVVSW
jgi:hypothetical protein